LADLLVQLGDDLLALVRRRSLPLEELGHPLPQRRLPLADQQRVHLVLPTNLGRGLDSHQRLQTHLGFEGPTILFAFSFHRSALSHVEQTSKSQA
jgi:hypothetical protein